MNNFLFVFPSPVAYQKSKEKIEGKENMGYKSIENEEIE